MRIAQLRYNTTSAAASAGQLTHHIEFYQPCTYCTEWIGIMMQQTVVTLSVTTDTTCSQL